MKLSAQSRDQDLLQACKQGNPLGQKYLYERYFGQMLGVSMRYAKSREEAIDVLNRAFLKVFDSLDSYQGTGALGAWIGKIVFHTAIDYVRKQSTYKKKFDFNIEKDLPVRNHALENLAAADIYKVIQQLPTESRTVFSLYVLEGYKHREIAKQLNISEGTSKWHLSNARKILQQLLKHRKQEYFSSNSGQE